MPQVVRDCALEIYGVMQAPLPLICSSLLGAMATVIQRHVDIRWFYEIESPTSLMILIQAESGERKSAVDKLTMKAIVEFNEKQRIVYQEALTKYKSYHSKWKRDLQAKLINYRLIAKDGESTESIDAEIAKLEENEPTKPKQIKLLAKDSTPEAIVKRLSDNGGCVGIVTAEGGLSLDGRTMSNPYLINSAWSGETIDFDRKTSESYYIDNPRLTMSTMIQPDVLEKIIRKHGNQLRANGFLGRNLHCNPTSTQGTRFIANPVCTWQHLPKLEARLTEILEMPLVNDDGTPKDRTLLKLSPDAEQVLLYFYNRVEYELGSGRILSDVKDAASKITENAARIAALFHFIEGLDGDIDALTMTNATHIAEYYLIEFKIIFGVDNQMPLVVQDAMALEKWICDIYRNHPKMTAFAKNDILQVGPNHLRHDKVRRDAAIDYLCANQRIQIAERNKKKWVLPNPVYFPIQTVVQQPMSPVAPMAPQVSMMSFANSIV